MNYYCMNCYYNSCCESRGFLAPEPGNMQEKYLIQYSAEGEVT
jgi:hypothetical protein